MAEWDKFVEHVDEELHEERVRQLWDRYRMYIIGGCIFFFMALFSYVGWQKYRENVDQSASNLYFSVQDALLLENVQSARTGLDRLVSEYDNHGYSKLAQLEQARLWIRSGARNEGIQKLEQFADEEQQGSLLRDFALLEAAYATVDSSGEEALRLLSKMGGDAVSSSSPYRALALELSGLIAEHSGDHKTALARYREAQDLNNASSALRIRLKQRVEQWMPFDQEEGDLP